MWGRRLAGAAALLVAVVVVPAAANLAPQDHLASAEPAGAGSWIVQLADPSLAVYGGGVEGLAPTSPQVTGAPQLDPAAPASRAYLRYLQQQQEQFAARMQQRLDRQVNVTFTYRHVLNGLTVHIDAAEAARVARLPQVAAVYPDELRQLETDVSHEAIGSAAIWDGNTGDGMATRGEGILVGMLDTGVNPGHPSFAATDGDGYTHTNPFGSGSYVGVCDPDHPRHEPICNDKLVGAWDFHPQSSTARDTHDHGSHTGSTMAGNRHQATFTIGDTEFTRTVQGVASRANVISYKVCEPTCPQSSMLAAVDQAIADGVDVLNYSISGADNPWHDPVDLAFLEAFNAGVFVAASAGNDGPAASTVAKTGPWNASTAASTTGRVFAQSLEVTAPAAVPPGLADIAAVPGQDRAPTEVIEAQIRDAAAVDEDNPRGCTPFPAGVFEGAIALIGRGDCTFADKINHAAGAGAVAVVVVDHAAGPPTVMGGLETTSRSSVMIDRSSGQQLRGFIADQAPDPVQVAIHPDTQLVTDPIWQDVLGEFSSRGPSRFDMLAPTFTAPGVNILAARRAAGGDTARYAVMQGTSMSAPHAAGAAALLMALHPDWSPAQVRSALAGTADPTRLVAEDGATPAGVFEQGSGLIDLAAAGRVGLVMDESYDDFLAADPAAGGEPKTLNLPAMVNRQCRVECAWTRTVTSTASVAATYTAVVDTPPGVQLDVAPSTFTLAAGQSQQLTITAGVAGAPVGQWLQAAVRLSTDAEHAGGLPVAGVRYPVAVIQASAELAVDPPQIDTEQGPGQQVAHTVTLGNPGGGDLTWNVVQDQPASRPASVPTGPATPVETVPAPQAAAGGQFAPGRNPHPPAGGPAGQGQAGPDQLPDGSVTVSHSQSQEITPGNSIACALSGTGTTVSNGYLRTFTLEDFAVFSDLEVTSVSFGVEAVNLSPMEATVRLYTLDAQPLTYANMTEIGSARQVLFPQGPGIVEVPVIGTVPEDATLVVEVAVPDTRNAAGLYIGSNPAGQSAPSYIRAETCQSIGPEPVDLADLGFPNMHIVMNVTGTAEAPTCDVPGGTPWAQVSPTSGTVASGHTQEVTVTLDSTGLTPGQVREATMCLETNAPARPYAIVPITLQVTDEPEPPGTSQDIVAVVPQDPGQGSLIVSVDPDDRTVMLPPMQLAGSGDRLATSGALRPVTVTDTRTSADPGWDASAQVSEFTGGSAAFGGGFLGWTPRVDAQSGGQQVTPGVPVAPGFPTGDGLSVPQTLATAPAGAGTGVAQLGAGLALEVPVDTPAGTYTAVLTLTAI